MTPANAYQLIEVGANALVAGSAVFGAKSYKDGELLCLFEVTASSQCLLQGGFCEFGEFVDIGTSTMVQLHSAPCTGQQALSVLPLLYHGEQGGGVSHGE